ncbi:acetoacetate decarboxylase [Halobellus sp. Atlit-31R]|nr:acetoacetate decarboxylase [Halobellus sp. Atlit-31R]
MTEDSAPETTTAAAVTLSTGHRVELPLVTQATMTGVVLSADYDAARALLPDSLAPIRMTPNRAGVTLLCVEYDRIGRRGEIEPYDEFGVLIPASVGSTPPPYASILTHGVSGYVWYLPVTTEPARALGVEIWGYPKEVAEITHLDEGLHRRTIVEVGDTPVIDITIPRPPTFDQTRTSESYTIRDGRVLREHLTIEGDVGFWPYSRVSYTLGDHPRGRRLRSLDTGDRALLSLAANVEFTISAGEPIAAR